jgi:PAS domain S-box-containing protein
MRSKSSTTLVRKRRNRGRSKAALVLFGRAVMTTFALFSGTLGFFTGIRLQAGNYDPYTYATGTGALLAAACTAISYLLVRRRAVRKEVRALEARVEALTDSNWELREAEERARSLLEAQGDLIVRRDAQGHVTYANDAYCSLTDKTRDALIGTKDDLHVIEQGAIGVFADGTRVYDQKIAGGDGARWIAWREVAVRSETGSEVQGVGRDVTDRVEAERALGAARDQAEAASRTKSRFLAMVSHEIRTPLNGMLGMADLLLDTPLTPAQRTYAKAAKTSGETLLSLIEEVLDFSKIEAGRLDLETRPFALGALIEEAVELLAPRAQAKGIEIASFVDECLPDGLVGDAARLRQVLLNLAGNAIKFTERGGVAVIVTPDEVTGNVRFEVRDTGIGLKGEDQARIFREFEQADGSSTRKFGGTGLGLAISKRIVERMNGHIDVASAPGAGSTFSFTVPLAAAIPDEDLRAFAAPELYGMSVMIVAEAEIEASLLARRLGRWGAKTCTAVDDEIASALLAERHWDALLIDYPLASAMIARGALNGRGETRRIVLIRPTERSELPALKAAGFTGYLVKPVRAASLAARLREDEAFEHTPRETAADIGESVSPRGGEGLSILVAEDNEINALLARALLTRLGHHPNIAGTGEAAVELWLAARAAGSPYDLVLMDVQMPVLDGLEAARRIRAAEAGSDLAPTRMLALTANAFPEDREAAIAAGMNDLLVKPLDPERLRQAIEAAPGAGSDPIAA